MEVTFIRGLFECGQIDLKFAHEEGCFLVEAKAYDDAEKLIDYASERGFNCYEEHFDGTETYLIEATSESTGMLVFVDATGMLSDKHSANDFIKNCEGGCCLQDGDYKITKLDIKSNVLPNLAALSKAIIFEK